MTCLFLTADLLYSSRYGHKYAIGRLQKTEGRRILTAQTQSRLEPWSRPFWTCIRGKRIRRGYDTVAFSSVTVMQGQEFGLAITDSKPLKVYSSTVRGNVATTYISSFPRVKYQNDNEQKWQGARLCHSTNSDGIGVFETNGGREVCLEGDLKYSTLLRRGFGVGSSRRMR